MCKLKCTNLPLTRPFSNLKVSPVDVDLVFSTKEPDHQLNVGRKGCYGRLGSRVPWYCKVDTPVVGVDGMPDCFDRSLWSLKKDHVPIMYGSNSHMAIVVDQKNRRDLESQRHPIFRSLCHIGGL